MAANVGKGDYGRLHDPKIRATLLKRYAHLTLEEAGKKLGVRKERARQLYRMYEVRRL